MVIPKNISVSIPTKEGFLSRECNNSECQKYFKVSEETAREEMYCPYCGDLQPINELHTKEQIDYAQEVAKETITKAVADDLSKMMSKIAKGSKTLQFKHKPYRPKYISKSKIDKEADSEITCSECGTIFQVYGIFGYCTSCRYENILIYDANLAIIRQEIHNSSNPDRALRHAYVDLVAAYEQFCKKKAKPFEEKHNSFQVLFEPRKYFKKQINVDIFDGLDDSELLVLRRVFQKRHAFQHGDGTITDDFIQKVPEDKQLLGTKANLTMEEFEEASQYLRVILNNLASTMMS